jgi:hypothetical protein
MTTMGGFGGATVGLALAFAPSACEIEGVPAGGGGAAGAGAVAAGAAGGDGTLRLPAALELRARWADAGVQETLDDTGAGLRRAYRRAGTAATVSFAPPDADRAMATGAVALGLDLLPAYAFARPAAGGCAARVDLAYDGTALRYAFAAEEPATSSSCAAFMGETARGAELVYESVPVFVSSAVVQAPPFVTLRVVFSP